ncbi:ubiquitin carboxyl-terminal hydrolase isozyme L3 [Syngnathus typhle]|uniref:ubiquitin carboxyl-terminal hydrolase isozyme L3 n=1 Tax=Syngnathus typhle TaxID=161592 RepID=UPI002A6ACC90|nr:ubiquitin carboxyl-terminal hydrolase isozyme L3 [Syngnathus typhle]
MSVPTWLPLEANPEVMTKFVSSLGMKQSWQFGDVYGLDTEMLSMVPRPVCAVLLLFPITEKYEAFKQEEEERLKTQQPNVPTDVYFMRQTIGNACGTIGLIHAVANNLKHLEFESDSALKKFVDRTCEMSPQQRGVTLETDESIRVTHESSAQEGQTEAPSIDEKVNLHFIAFVNVGGQLYELDGGKPFPILHGKTSEDTLLEDSVEVCKTFMARDPQEVRFTIIALSKDSY